MRLFSLYAALSSLLGACVLLFGSLQLSVVVVEWLVVVVAVMVSIRTNQATRKPANGAEARSGYPNA